VLRVKALAAAFIAALLFSALVSPMHFARGAGSFSVSIVPLYASIDLGESVEFNSTVTGDVIPSEYQWFLNGTAFAGATSSSWTFTPSTIGIYNVYLIVYVAVNNSTGNESQSEAMSQTARIMAGSQSLTGILGYPHESSQAEASGTQFTTDGSRFILNVEANVTSMSCLMSYWLDSTYPNQNYSYSFAIYRDNEGAIGSLVAQTVHGTITTNDPHNVKLWLTLNFPSVVHLAPGAYWLMEVDNSTGQVDKGNAVQNTFETVSSFIEGMTFPDSLPSPIYSSNYVICIYASWDVSFSARLAEGKNVFAVASNSTVSSLAYNSTTSELNFSVSGSSGTTGYTEVFISKALLQDPSELTVFIDGEQTNFTSTSVYDFWALHFVYSHSTHSIAINLQSNAVPEFPSLIILAPVTIATLLALLYFKKRKH
jgi:hypothetical protein